MIGFEIADFIMLLVLHIETKSTLQEQTAFVWMHEVGWRRLLQYYCTKMGEKKPKVCLIW